MATIKGILFYPELFEHLCTLNKLDQLSGTPPNLSEEYVELTFASQFKYKLELSFDEIVPIFCQSQAIVKNWRGIGSAAATFYLIFLFFPID